MSVTPSCSFPALNAAGAAGADLPRNAEAVANADPLRKSSRRLNPPKYRPKALFIERFTNTSRFRNQGSQSVRPKPQIRYTAYQNAGLISDGKIKPSREVV